MANPNIVNVTSIYGKTVQAALDTTLTTEILLCAADKVLKINSIQLQTSMVLTLQMLLYLLLNQVDHQLQLQVQFLYLQMHPYL
jgi:hypothetical protein